MFFFSNGTKKKGMTIQPKVEGENQKVFRSLI